MGMPTQRYSGLFPYQKYQNRELQGLLVPARRYLGKIWKCYCQTEPRLRGKTLFYLHLINFQNAAYFGGRRWKRLGSLKNKK